MSAGLLLDLPRFSGPALCAETDPELFNPDRGGTSRPAKAVCRSCEVRDECLTYALDRELVRAWDGVWGGTSPRERARMLRDRERAGVEQAAVEYSVDVAAAGPPCQDFSVPAQPAVDAAPAAAERPVGALASSSPTPIRREDRAPSAPVTARGWTDVELTSAVATCRAAGLTRAEVAAELGVSTAAVRRAEASTAEAA